MASVYANQMDRADGRNAPPPLLPNRPATPDDGDIENAVSARQALDAVPGTSILDLIGAVYDAGASRIGRYYRERCRARPAEEINFIYSRPLAEGDMATSPGQRIS